MSEFTSTALLLRSVTVGEGHRVATFLTEKHGKVAGVVRRSKGRGSSVDALQPFHRLRVKLLDRGRELLTVREVSVDSPRTRLLSTLEKMEAAGELLRWVRHLCPPMEPEPLAFSIVDSFFETLDEGEPYSQGDAAIAAVRLLAATGYRLELERCVRCSKECPGARSAYLSVSAGGVVCTRCGGARRLVSPAMRALVASIQRGDHPKPDDESARGILEIMQEVLEVHTGS